MNNAPSDPPPFAGRPVVTVATTVTLIAVFIAQSAWDDGHGRLYLHMGGLVPEQALQGDVWQLFSYAVLHAGMQHIAGNLMGLLSLGSFCERILGSARFAVLLILSALGGGLACLLVTRPVVVVGASGAIWGLLGMSTALALRPGELLPPGVKETFRRNTLVNLGIQLLVSAMPGVSAAAHIGGGLVGFVLMLSGLIRPPEAHYERAPERASIPWVATAAALALVLAGCVATAWVRGRPWELGKNDVDRVLDGV